MSAVWCFIFKKNDVIQLILKKQMEHLIQWLQDFKRLVSKQKYDCISEAGFKMQSFPVTHKHINDVTVSEDRGKYP